MRGPSTSVLSMVGKTYGKLVVTGWLLPRERTHINNSLSYRCACGIEGVTVPANLTTGNTWHCGCQRGDKYNNDGARHELYGTWNNMIQRCHNSNSHNYKYYGGRGIAVCKEWRASLNVFLADMGPKPTPQYTLDRIDNDGNYEPSNCRWATKTTQSNNRNPKGTFA